MRDAGRDRHGALKAPRFHDRRTWRRLSALVRRERGGLCEQCLALGVVRAATEVDHRIAVADGGEPFDRANLIVLCKACHSSKTVQLDRGFGRKPGERARVKGCDAHGRPLDPQHWWRVPILGIKAK